MASPGGFWDLLRCEHRTGDTGRRATFTFLTIRPHEGSQKLGESAESGDRESADIKRYTVAVQNGNIVLDSYNCGPKMHSKALSGNTPTCTPSAQESVPVQHPFTEYVVHSKIVPEGAHSFASILPYRMRAPTPPMGRIQLSHIMTPLFPVGSLYT